MEQLFHRLSNLGSFGVLVNVKNVPIAGIETNLTKRAAARINVVVKMIHGAEK